MTISRMGLFVIAFLAVLPATAKADQFRFVVVKGADQAFLGGARVGWDNGQVACFTNAHGFCEILQSAGTYQTIIEWQGLRFTPMLTFDGASDVKTQYLTE